MAQSHTPPPSGHAHRTADQPPVEVGQTPGGPETAGTDGERRIAALSSQLKGLAANVARAGGPEENPPADAEDTASPVAVDGADTAEPASEEDWGIAPARRRMSRETMLGLAFVFVLVAVFSFVVYKKIEYNRAQSQLLAAAQEPAPDETPPEPEPETSLQNPIAESQPFPPVQNDFEEPQTIAATETTPAAWNPNSFDSQPQQELTSTPPPAGEPASPAIDQFPPAAGHDFAPPVESASSQPFPAESAFPPAQTESAPPSPPADVAATPFPETPADDAPPAQSFEPTPELANQSEPPQAAPTAEETQSFNPFGQESMPAPSEPAATAQTLPEADDEQFSTQSQPLPQEEPATVTATGTGAENPFGEFPAAPAESASAEVAAEETVSASPSDPFAVPPPTQPEPAGAPSASTAAQAFEPVETVPAEEFPAPPANDFVEQESPAPAEVEIAQPDTVPVDSIPVESAPVEMPVANDPRFGDFQPAPPNQEYEPHPAGVPNELPRDVITQLTAAELTTDSAGQMQPADRPRAYVVRPGDNYWNISKKQYGTVRYFMALARYNRQRIPDPKKMRPGMKVLIPSREILESRNPDLFPKFTANTGVSNVGHKSGPSGFYLADDGTPMYRVGANDTLGGIAHKHLGRFSRWVEIYQLNKHRLKDPNALTLGDVLILPADASRVSMIRPASGSR